ncbi:MAG: hypothetical protein J6D57_00440, partial [Mogibacterium sp.]|nr:hypothetical protein [Mogibacterium sp.]
ASAASFLLMPVFSAYFSTNSAFVIEIVSFVSSILEYAVSQGRRGTSRNSLAEYTTFQSKILHSNEHIG